MRFFYIRTRLFRSVFQLIFCEFRFEIAPRLIKARIVRPNLGIRRSEFRNGTRDTFCSLKCPVPGHAFPSKGHTFDLIVRLNRIVIMQTNVRIRTRHTYNSPFYTAVFYIEIIFWIFPNVFLLKYAFSILNLIKIVMIWKYFQK